MAILAKDLFSGESRAALGNHKVPAGAKAAVFIFKFTSTIVALIFSAYFSKLRRLECVLNFTCLVKIRRIQLVRRKAGTLFLKENRTTFVL
jgi:hypothetical protein